MLHSTPLSSASPLFRVSFTTTSFRFLTFSGTNFTAFLASLCTAFFTTFLLLRVGFSSEMRKKIEATISQVIECPATWKRMSHCRNYERMTNVNDKLTLRAPLVSALKSLCPHPVSVSCSTRSWSTQDFEHFLEHRWRAKPYALILEWAEITENDTH